MKYKTAYNIVKVVNAVIKIRLHGTKPEIDKTISYLELVMELYSVSGYYKDRGNSQYYRVYVEAEMFELTIK